MRARFCASQPFNTRLTTPAGSSSRKSTASSMNISSTRRTASLSSMASMTRWALVGVHIGKYVRCDVLGQEPEHHQHFFIVKFLHVLGDVYLVEHGERAAQFALAALGHELVQTRANFLEIHRLHPPSVCSETHENSTPPLDVLCLRRFDRCLRMTAFRERSVRGRADGATSGNAFIGHTSSAVVHALPPPGIRMDGEKFPTPFIIAPEGRNVKTRAKIFFASKELTQIAAARD